VPDPYLILTPSSSLRVEGPIRSEALRDLVPRSRLLAAGIEASSLARPEPPTTSLLRPRASKPEARVTRARNLSKTLIRFTIQRSKQPHAEGIKAWFGVCGAIVVEIAARKSPINSHHVLTQGNTCLVRASARQLHWKSHRETPNQFPLCPYRAHPKDIKAILGHADIHTTMRYVHATDEGKRKAVEAAAKARRTNQSASHMPHKTKAS